MKRVTEAKTSGGATSHPAAEKLWVLVPVMAEHMPYQECREAQPNTQENIKGREKPEKQLLGK